MIVRVGNRRLFHTWFLWMILNRLTSMKSGWLVDWLLGKLLWWTSLLLLLVQQNLQRSAGCIEEWANLPGTSQSSQNIELKGISENHKKRQKLIWNKSPRKRWEAQKLGHSTAKTCCTCCNDRSSGCSRRGGGKSPTSFFCYFGLIFLKGHCWRSKSWMDRPVLSL